MLQSLIVASLQIERYWRKIKSKIFDNKRSWKSVWAEPGRQLESRNVKCHIKSALINRPIIQLGQHWNQTSQIRSNQNAGRVINFISKLLIVFFKYRFSFPFHIIFSSQFHNTSSLNTCLKA